jgi:hypothetical protein
MITNRSLSLLPNPEGPDTVPDPEDLIEQSLIGERGQQAGGPVKVPFKHEQVTNVHLTKN